MTTKLWRLDKLYEIGTPDAAIELAQLIWKTDDKAHHAAWRLASMLANSGIEEALQSLALTQEQMQCEQIEWVWEPFMLQEHSAMKAIGGRLAYLLNTTPVNLLFHQNSLKPDPRLVIPLCAIVAQKSMLEWINIRKELRNSENISSPLNLPTSSFSDYSENSSMMDADVNVVSDQAKDSFSDDLKWRHLIFSLPQNLRSRLLEQLIASLASPNENNWRNLFHKIGYQFVGSWQAKAFKGLIILILMLGLWQLGGPFVNSVEYSPWSNEDSIVWGLINFFYICYLWRQVLDIRTAFIILFLFGLSGSVFLGIIFEVITFESSLDLIICFAFVGVIVGAIIRANIGAIYDISKRMIIGGIIAGICGGIFGGIVVGSLNIASLLVDFMFIEIAIWIFDTIIIILINSPTMLLLSQMSPLTVISFWIVWFLLCSGLLTHVMRRERSAHNPLYGLLDEYNRAIPRTQRRSLFGLSRSYLSRWLH